MGGCEDVPDVSFCGRLLPLGEVFPVVSSFSLMEG